MRRLAHCSLALVLVLSTSLSSGGSTQNNKRTDPEMVIVFVCEHGSAKSVVAAAHFNRLAIARKVSIRAIARGTNPDQTIAPSTAAGLKSDGLPIGIRRPKKLSTPEFSRAIRVIAMCELPHPYSDDVRVEKWDDVPSVSEDYGKARDVLVQKIVRLLDQLTLAR